MFVIYAMSVMWHVMHVMYGGTHVRTYVGTHVCTYGYMHVRTNGRMDVWMD